MVIIILISLLCTRTFYQTNWRTTENIVESEIFLPEQLIDHVDDVKQLHNDVNDTIIVPSTMHASTEGSDRFGIVQTNEHETKIQELQLTGKRIVDINYFINSLKLISNHNPIMGCSLQNMIVVNENRRGLHSTITMKCLVCNICETLQTSFDAEGINEKAVLGVMTVGGGFSNLEQIMGAIEIPCGSHSTFDKYHDKVCVELEKTAKNIMAEAVEEEKKIAIECGDVVNGVPFITIICDGFWSKRSYRTNYSALSGCAAILGAKTKKVLHIGVRNKFCVYCKKNEKMDVKISHQCFKNWKASSSSMESDIICEGFERSVELYGIIFKTMVADGDSSCYKKILESNPYKNYNVQVAKIECRNHLLRNYINKLTDVSKSTDLGPLILRRKIKVNLISSVAS